MEREITPEFMKSLNKFLEKAKKSAEEYGWKPYKPSVLKGLPKTTCEKTYTVSEFIDIFEDIAENGLVSKEKSCLWP